jgi:hypothetical protein
MEEFYPRTINRAIIILLPRQPALDWIMRVEPEQEPQTLANIRQDCDALMVSQREVDSVESAQKWVHGNWEMFFDEFLGDWYTDEEVWPEKRTLKMFNQWFDIHYQSNVWDFADEPIEHDEDAEDEQA